MPIEIRSRSGGRLRNFNCSAGTLAWDILLGKLMDELTLPKLTVMWNILAAAAMALENGTEPVVKLNTEPAPRACEHCSSYPQLSFNPG